MSARCVRLVKKTGKPCQESRHRWSDEIGLPDPQSCRRHMTKEERAAVDDYYERLYAEARQVIARGPGAMRAVGARAFAVSTDAIRLRLPEPACWYWPAPETCAFKDEDTAGQFLLHWHNGMCAACGAVGALVLDHDHETALIRGYLCRSCNGLEAHASKDSLLGKYRQRNPASIFGIKIKYWSPWTGYAEPDPVVATEEGAAQRIRDAVDQMAEADRPLDLGRSPGYLLATYLADGE